MADTEEEEDHERQCQELLLKLKRTTESLLARQSVSGAWATYGALRRIVADTENILSHRIREDWATRGSEGSFWGFVQGLKWLCPSLAPMIDKVNRHSGAQKGGATGGGGRSNPEAARAWLTESVQDHSFLPQMEVLIGNREHLHSFYHDDAFLCQSEHVEAMRVCFRAIELNKPALLTDISPRLLRTSQPPSGNSTGQKFSSPDARSFRRDCVGGAGGGSTPLDAADGYSRLTRTYSARDSMGNRHPRLDASYSGQLSRSNLSLSVDPSLGASSLLHQKTLSSPYFVSSLDSPRVLQHLHGDIRDAIRLTSGQQGPFPYLGQGHQAGQISPLVTSEFPGGRGEDGPGPRPLSGSISAGNIAAQGSPLSVSSAAHTGSSPQLSLLNDPEVAVVSEGQTSRLGTSAGLEHSISEGQALPVDSSAFCAEPEAGADNLLCGAAASDPYGKASQQPPAAEIEQRDGSDNNNDLFPSSSREDVSRFIVRSDGDNALSTLRPKSFSDASLYKHEPQPLQPPSQSALEHFEQASSQLLSEFCDASMPHEVSTDSPHRPRTGSVPLNHPIPGASSCESDISEASSHIGQDVGSPSLRRVPASQGSSKGRAISHISVALDATSLNSNIICESEYGLDGVLLGLSPPDASSNSSLGDVIASEKVNGQQHKSNQSGPGKGILVSRLPETGESPTDEHSSLTSKGDRGSERSPAGGASVRTCSPESGARPKMSTVRSEPHLAMTDPLLSPSPPMPTIPQRGEVPSFAYPHLHNNPPNGSFAASPPAFSGTGMPFSDADLYGFSPPSSPFMLLGEGAGGRGSQDGVDRTPGGRRDSITTPVKYPGGGAIYIPERGLSLDRGLPGISALASAAGLSNAGGSNGGSGGSLQTASPAPPSAASSVTSPQRRGHKRWVSDTSAIQVSHQEKLRVSATKSGATPERVGAPDTGLYLSSMTKPAEGQSLISYLTSQDFNTCANLDKENAHFHIAEALISAFESMSWNRMMKQSTHSTAIRNKSMSTSSEDEEITELRQRIRIRKREKMSERGHPFPSPSDHSRDAAATSTSALSLVSSQDVSSLSDVSSEGSGSDEDSGQIDLTMSSSEAQGSLSALRSSGLSLSMASLYSEIELQKSNQQLEKSSVTSGSTEEQGTNSAEAVAISLLRRFSEKQLPKASELRWLVSERDAPQALLPLPAPIPVSTDDQENSILLQSARQPRLRGNHEWAPPRAQIIFSVHPTEKRAVVMKRQNFRCAGCGLKVDPAFIKRFRYCEYLGKFFCQCCHTGETSAIIPGRVLERWDFARYPVSAFSHSLLDRMWGEPLFHVSTINAGLYRRVRTLESIREGRRQLVHLHSLLVVCRRDARIIKELQKLPAHWVSNEDAYSMEDFMQVKSGAMLSVIKSFISLAVAHIDTCPLCQGLGFICEMCNDPKVIFPFQLDTVVSCQVCQVCYHKQCFVPGKCPKCIRMEARRKLTSVQLSPESPDSGEITLTNSQTDDEEEESVAGPAPAGHGTGQRAVIAGVNGAR